MAKVRYRVREYTPSDKQIGNHAFYAEAVINTDITSQELAKKIAARTGMKSYEAVMAIHAIADIVAEETLEGSRVSLTNEDGTKLVTIYPKVSGSISDADVVANPAKYPGKTRATEDMLTADLLSWTLGATIGTKYSRQFALNKQAQKVKYVATDITATDEEDNNGGTRAGGSDTGSGTGSNPSSSDSSDGDPVNP